jgi:hypothetical protein
MFDFNAADNLNLVRNGRAPITVAQGMGILGPKLVIGSVHAVCSLRLMLHKCSNDFEYVRLAADNLNSRTLDVAQELLFLYSLDQPYTYIPDTHRRIFSFSFTVFLSFPHYSIFRARRVSVILSSRRYI